LKILHTNKKYWVMIHSRIKLIHTKAKYTVRVCKILLTKCVQAHDNCFEVLPHIILYLLMTRPRTLGSPGLVTPSFLTFRISKNSVFEENEIVSKNRQKIKKKILTGPRLSHPPK
jgi:hypothetical protein